jgi:hypothetical protein
VTDTPTAADTRTLSRANWRPIRSAPRKTEVLVWDGWCGTALCDDQGQWWLSAGGVPCFPDDGSDGEYRLTKEQVFPSHWMPKPEGPTE